jgi:hypothetical protein
VWAIALLAVAFIPALAMALWRRGDRRVPAAGAAPVLD